MTVAQEPCVPGSKGSGAAGATTRDESSGREKRRGAPRTPPRAPNKRPRASKLAMQAPADDAWGHWFPFVQHNPVLGDKKSWRDRAELLRRLERDGIIVAKGKKKTGWEKGRAAREGLRTGEQTRRGKYHHLPLSNACFLIPQASWTRGSAPSWPRTWVAG